MFLLIRMQRRCIGKQNKNLDENSLTDGTDEGEGGVNGGDWGGRKIGKTKKIYKICIIQKKAVPLRRFLCAMSEQFSFLNEK